MIVEAGQILKLTTENGDFFYLKLRTVDDWFFLKSPFLTTMHKTNFQFDECFKQHAKSKGWKIEILS